MDEKVINIAENITVLRVVIMEFNLETSKDYSNNPTEPNRFDFSLGKEIAHNFEEGMARYRVHFDFKALNDSDEDLGLKASFSLEFHFKINDFASFIKEVDGKIKVDINLASSLMAIAYSTSRGIILEKTQNSYFNGIILPVIDPTKFLLKEEFTES